MYKIEKPEQNKTSPDRRSYFIRILLALVILLGPLLIFQVLQYTLLPSLLPLLPFYSDPFYEMFYSFAPLILFEVVAIAIIMVLILIDRKNTTFRDLHFNKPDVPKSNLWFLATFGFGFFVAIGYLIVWTCFLFPIPRPVSDVRLFLFETFLYLILYLLVGVSEEFYFRGYIQANAYKVYDRRFAPVFASLLFAAIHIPKFVFAAIFNVDPSQLILMLLGFHTVFVIGLWLAYIRDNLKVIWASIIAHAFWDFWLSALGPDLNYIFGLPPFQQIYLLIFALTAPYAMFGTLIFAWILSSRVLKVEDLGEATYGFDREIKKLSEKLDKITRKIPEFQQLLQHAPYERSQAILKRTMHRIEARKAFLESVILLKQDSQKELTLFNISETRKIDKERVKTMKIEYRSNLMRPAWKMNEMKVKTPSELGYEYERSPKESIKKCPSCGSSWSGDSRFCAKCGKKLL